MWKVIVADDEPFIREALREMIPWERLGCRLEAVLQNGREAVEAWERLRPDMAVLDIHMPVLTGLEAAEKIRARDREAAILLLTAHADFQYAQQAIALQVRRYILKKNLLEELPRALREIGKTLRNSREKELTGARGKAVRLDGEAAMDAAGEAAQENDLIAAINRFVDENSCKKIGLDDVAAAVHANRSYISRIYRERTGEKLFDAINHRKIEAAKRYMEESRLKIYEIADAVGWRDAAYFSRVFRKYTGCSPREYAQKFGDGCKRD